MVNVSTCSDDYGEFNKDNVKRVLIFVLTVPLLSLATVACSSLNGNKVLAEVARGGVDEKTASVSGL